jgi:hypothetical protein
MTNLNEFDSNGAAIPPKNFTAYEITQQHLDAPVETITVSTDHRPYTPASHTLTGNLLPDLPSAEDLELTKAFLDSREVTTPNPSDLSTESIALLEHERQLRENNEETGEDAEQVTAHQFILNQIECLMQFLTHANSETESTEATLTQSQWAQEFEDFFNL